MPGTQLDLTVNRDISNVKFNVDSTLHTVHGTFSVARGSLRIEMETGKASGEIVVFVTSGDTGNSSRDDKMHTDVLQSKQYPEAVFLPSAVEGVFGTAGVFDVKLHGILRLHGADHEITVPVHVELGANSWQCSAKFDVPYIQWGMKSPNSFFLKVQPVVHVEVALAGPRPVSTRL